MTPSILILENDPVQADALEDIITSYSLDIKVLTTTSVQEATEIIEATPSVEAFFLDISMNETAEDFSGLDLAIHLASNDKTRYIPIIFITGFPEHTYKAINQIHCFAYILKPYTKKDIHKQLDDIFLNSSFNSTISIRTLDGIYIKLDLREIYYIESHGRYMYFHTSHGEIKSRQYRLKELLSLLNKDFAQCHKSYIINSRYIESILPSERLIKIKDLGDTIPFTKDYQYL